MTIEAMKLALEALKSIDDAMPFPVAKFAMKQLRQAIEQAEQAQPVAWSVLDKRTGKHWYTNESKYTAQHQANEYGHREPDGTRSMVVLPLYTAPPPRQPWVGLTDEEILKLEETTTCLGDESWLRNLTRNIEAKLRSKNEDRN